MDAPAKTSLLQRVIDTWKHVGVDVGDSEFDAADVGTAFGMECSLLGRQDTPAFDDRYTRDD
jgi:hypothetical protein